MAKVIVQGYIEVPESDLDAVKAALPYHVRATRAEPGCLVFTVEQNIDDPRRFDIYEEFIHRQAFEAHQQRTSESGWKDLTSKVKRIFQVVEND